MCRTLGGVGEECEDLEGGERLKLTTRAPQTSKQFIITTPEWG